MPTLDDLTLAEDAGKQLQRGSALGRYLIIERVGQGGMGEVYAAYDPKLDRRVAIKVLQLDAASDATTRLEAEGRALARVRHPNVVTVHDLGLRPGGLFVAMEFIDGEPLSSWIAASRDSSRCVEVFTAAARGLAAAHAAGIVHRDFKPANVMLEHGGRVVVLDFGLARLSPGSRATPSGEFEVSGDAPATHSAAGTPGYMAPEQINGDPVTSASDQFSWSVSLYQALHGRLPFAGRHAVERLESIRAGLSESAGSDGVPRWLDRIVRRGLAADPEARFASMSAVVAALDNGKARRRRGVQLAVVTLGSVAAVTAGVQASQTDEQPSLACVREAKEAFEVVWDLERAEALSTAFDGSGRPHAASTAQRVRRRVDSYAATWHEIAAQACHATLVDSVASQDTLRGRQACLASQTSGLNEVLTVLQDVSREPAVVDHAISIVAALASPRTCLARHAVTVPPAAVQAAVAAVRAGVARCAARRAAGQFKRAAQEIATALAQAEALNPTPALVEALAERARLHDARGEYDAALNDAARAVAVATELDLPQLQTEGALTVMRIQGQRLGAYDEAERWLAISEGAARRLAGDDLLNAKLLWNRGAVQRRRGDAVAAEASLREALALYEAGDEDPLPLSGLVVELAEALGDQAKYDDAAVLIERTLALRVEALGPMHPGVADTLTSLATSAGRQGRVRDAIALGRRALSLYETGVDQAHPNVGTILNNLAIEYVEAGRLPEALASYDRSLAVREAALGPLHEDVGETLTNRGWALFAAGRNREALRDLKRSVAIIEAAKGEHAPDLISALTNLGQVAQAQGDLALSIECQRRSLAIATRTRGPQHPSLGVAHHNLGDALATTERCEQAVPHFERAIEVFEAVHGPEHRSVAYPVTSWGRCHLDAGRVTEAVALLRRAYEIRSAAAVAPQELGTTAMTLCHALWSAPKTRPQARAMADRGLAALAAAGPGAAEQLAAAQLWVDDNL